MSYLVAMVCIRLLPIPIKL